MKGKGGKITYTISLIIYSILVFVISLIMIGKFMNAGNTDMTTVMSDATYPVVTMRCAGQEFNELHGYALEQNISKFRESITPFFSDRVISFRVYTYDAIITSIKYELRNIEDNRLIENNEVFDYVESNGMINGNLTLKDLIEANKEYSLCICLETNKGQNIRYYTTVIESDNYGLGEKLGYVYNFSDNTFDKVNAEQNLAMYLESNASGDNSTFNYVDIHSSLEQITWGNLAVTRTGEPIATIRDIDGDTAVIFNDYIVTVAGTGGDEYYKVQERYRIRQGNERMYLLSFERSMDQCFSLESSIIANNKIVLGITDEEVNMMENPDGSRLAFVNDGRLYSYNVTDNKMAFVFGFYDDVPSDKREAYGQHDIKIFSVDETGNIYFMVYGYMNRGIHEGMMGAAVYYYDSVLNTVEENIFVPYNESFEIMSLDVEQLSYVNALSRLYIINDKSLYEVDLTRKEASCLIENIDAHNFVASQDASMVAWSDVKYNNGSITWLDMRSNSQKSILPTDGESIKPLGFFDDNLIYGVAHNRDVGVDGFGNQIFPMHKLIIETLTANVLKEYSENNIYVMDVVATDSKLQLTRTIKSGETGEFVATTDDQILNNAVDVSSRIKIETAITDNYETLVQIAFNNDIDVKNMQVLTPRQVIYEGERSLTFEDQDESIKEYYVYNNGILSGTFGEPAKALALAYSAGGMVVDNRGIVVYRKSVLMTKNQIMAIKGKLGDESSAVAVCLDTILEFNGISVSSNSLLSTMSPEQILEEKLDGRDILDLTGCDLQAMLYYVEKDIPVLVLLNDGTAVLLIGYNELNIVVMNPLTGTVYKVGMNDSTQWFLENGNRFVTYI